MKLILLLVYTCTLSTEHIHQNSVRRRPAGSELAYRTNDVDVLKKIFHGSDAVIGQFPFQIRIAFSSYWSDTLSSSCGGAILEESWVITAAHCIAFDENERTYLEPSFIIRIAAGDLHVKVNEGGEQFREVDWIYAHPEYDTVSLKNDIALLHLTEPFVFQSNIAPIPLTNTSVSSYPDVLVSGWGVTHSTFPSNKLKFMKQAVQSTEVCRNRYPYDVMDGMFCCGYYNMTQKTGSGDSGGPVVGSKNGTTYLTGLVSWSPADSATGLFDVNTDVFHFKDWILNKITPPFKLENLVATETQQEYVWTNQNVRFSYNHINITCPTASCRINIKSISVHFGEDVFTTLYVTDGWEPGHKKRRLKISRLTKDMAAKSVGFVSVGNKALALMYTGDSGDLVTIKFKYFLYNQTLHCGDPVNKCNEENDCTDLSDETGCNYPYSPTPSNLAVGCYPSDFVCNPYANLTLIQCVRKVRRCDGYHDCVNAADEKVALCASRASLNVYSYILVFSYLAVSTLVGGI